MNHCLHGEFNLILLDETDLSYPELSYFLYLDISGKINLHPLLTLEYKLLGFSQPFIELKRKIYI